MIVEHFCHECRKYSFVKIVFGVTKAETLIVKIQHPNWDIQENNIGRICCPYCGTTNFIVISS